MRAIRRGKKNLLTLVSRSLKFSETPVGVGVIMLALQGRREKERESGKGEVRDGNSRTT